MGWPRKSWTDLMNDSLKKEDGMLGNVGEAWGTSRDKNDWQGFEVADLPERYPCMLRDTHSCYFPHLYRNPMR